MPRAGCGAALGQAIANCQDAVVSVYSGLDRRVFQELGWLRPGDSCEAVPHDAIPGRLALADVLLLPHGFSDPNFAAEEVLTIFPTKAIDYLASGRPMLAHSPPDSYLTRFLLENDCAPGRRPAGRGGAECGDRAPAR